MKTNRILGFFKNKFVLSASLIILVSAVVITVIIVQSNAQSFTLIEDSTSYLNDKGETEVVFESLQWPDIYSLNVYSVTKVNLLGNESTEYYLEVIVYEGLHRPITITGGVESDQFVDELIEPGSYLIRIKPNQYDFSLRVDGLIGCRPGSSAAIIMRDTDIFEIELGN